MAVLHLSIKVALSSNKAVILVLYISVSRYFYIGNIFLSLIFDSVFRSVTPFPDSRFQVLGLPSVHQNMQQNSFSVKQQLSLLQKKSADKNVLYTLSKKLKVTYKGQNCRKKLAVE
ncbi:hypothetical protein ABFA07_022578 [Porites harrisoni]